MPVIPWKSCTLYLNPYTQKVFLGILPFKKDKFKNRPMFHSGKLSSALLHSNILLLSYRCCTFYMLNIDQIRHNSAVKMEIWYFFFMLVLKNNNKSKFILSYLFSKIYFESNQTGSELKSAENRS